MNNLDLDLIYAYTRAQAIEDGEQILADDIHELMAYIVKRWGYKYPIYITRTV